MNKFIPVICNSYACMYNYIGMCPTCIFSYIYLLKGARINPAKNSIKDAGSPRLIDNVRRATPHRHIDAGFPHLQHQRHRVTPPNDYHRVEETPRLLSHLRRDTPHRRSDAGFPHLDKHIHVRAGSPHYIFLSDDRRRDAPSSSHLALGFPAHNIFRCWVSPSNHV